MVNFDFDLVFELRVVLELPFLDSFTRLEDPAGLVHSTLPAWKVAIVYWIVRPF